MGQLTQEVNKQSILGINLLLSLVLSTSPALPDSLTYGISPNLAGIIQIFVLFPSPLLDDSDTYFA